MNGEKYQTVLDVIARGSHPMLCHLLEEETGSGKNLVARLTTMLEACEAALDRHDDQISKEIVAWIFHAISDVELIPLLRMEGGIKYLPYAYPNNSVEAAEQRARRARAKKAIELWPKLPSEVVKDGRRIPVLIETKKAVLTEIAGWWRDAPDEKESGKFLAFLVDLQSIFVEERKMIQGVIREKTGLFNPERLARQFVAVVSSGDVDDEVAKIIAIGWVRSIKLADLAAKLKTIEPLVNCSSAAHEFTESVATKIAELDRDAQRLGGFFGQADPFKVNKLPKGCESVPGRLMISYSSPNIVRAELVISVGFGFEENQWHDWFNAAERDVRCWQAMYHYSVDLIVKVVRNDNRGEIIFERSQRLALRH